MVALPLGDTSPVVATVAVIRLERRCHMPEKEWRRVLEY
jgi:hypothetical protein